MSWSFEARLAVSACRCSLFSARCWPAFFLINRFFGLSITINLSGMARTRAGLSGRPTCRSGVIRPGLSAPQGWPLAAMSAGLPVGTLRPCLTSCLRAARRGKCRASSSYLAVGQPVVSSCLGCWFWLFCRLGALLLLVLDVWAVLPCAACRASKTVMAAGHPFMGRGSRRRWGNPEGVPRSQTVLRRFCLRRWSSYPRFFALQLQAIFIGKKTKGTLQV